LLLFRKPEGRYEPHEEWASGPIEVPAAGETQDLDLNGEVAGQIVQLVKVFAAGVHRFTINEPSCLGSITPPLAQEGAGWKASAVHRPGHVDWTVESEQPFVVWKQGPQRPVTLFSRAFDPGGKQIGIDEVYDSVYGNNTIVAILKDTPKSEAFLFKPARTDMRSVYFFIDPDEAIARTLDTKQ
jgi:hypothetical protein